MQSAVAPGGAPFVGTGVAGTVAGTDGTAVCVGVAATTGGVVSDGFPRLALAEIEGVA